MKLGMIISASVLFFCAASYADEVNSLRDLTRESETYQELTIDCLIEMKISKEKGWESEKCSKYKSFSKGDLQKFKSQVSTATIAFTEYSKSGNASNSRVRRGLKQLMLIQENMESILRLSNKIKSESKT